MVITLNLQKVKSEFELLSKPPPCDPDNETTKALDQQGKRWSSWTLWKEEHWGNCPGRHLQHYSVRLFHSLWSWWMGESVPSFFIKQTAKTIDASAAGSPDLDPIKTSRSVLNPNPGPRKPNSWSYNDMTTRIKPERF